MENKYYCKQVNPEFAESYLFYQFKDKKTGHYGLSFNDDYYADNIIIDGNNNYMSYWPAGLEHLTKNLEWFNSDLVGYCGEHGSLTELANYYFKKWNGKRWSKRELAQWRKVSDLTDDWTRENGEEALLLALKLITGKTWRSYSMRGYCQGDWQEGYASEDVSEEALNYMEMCYFNTGEEYLIYDNEKNFNNEEADTSIYVDGYNKRERIAEYLECKPEDLIIYEFDGYTKTPKYKLAD